MIMRRRRRNVLIGKSSECKWASRLSSCPGTVPSTRCPARAQRASSKRETSGQAPSNEWSFFSALFWKKIFYENVHISLLQPRAVATFFSCHSSYIPNWVSDWLSEWLIHHYEFRVIGQWSAITWLSSRNLSSLENKWAAMSVFQHYFLWHCTYCRVAFFESWSPRSS